MNPVLTEALTETDRLSRFRERPREHRRRLPTPEELDALFPLTMEAREKIVENRAAIADVIGGRDGRLLIIAGPCSLDASMKDGEYTAVQFAKVLAGIQAEFRDDALIVFRGPTSKPRTGGGWRGLDTTNPVEAYEIITQIVERGVPYSAEIKHDVTYSRYGKMMSMAWTGARAAETDVRDEVARNPHIPALIKNDASGGLQAALSAIDVARGQHENLFCDDGDWYCDQTEGNQNTGLIFRGGGQIATPEEYHRQLGVFAETGFSIVADTSHGGSAAHDCGKKSVLGQQRCLQTVETAMLNGVPIRGVMIEANMVEGGPSECTPGMSRTDPCVGPDSAHEMISRIVAAHRLTR